MQNYRGVYFYGMLATSISGRLAEMSELAKFSFFWRAIWADFKQSRRWKIVTISYGLAGLVFLVMRFVTTWTPAQLLASWSGKAKLILLMAFLCIGLILLLIAVVDGARRIHLERIAPLNATIESQKWLGKLEERDRQAMGDGVAIAGCEVTLDLECSQPWAEFRFTVFNGSVFPITIGDATGSISFANGSDKPRKLTEELKCFPSNWLRKIASATRDAPSLFASN